MENAKIIAVTEHLRIRHFRESDFDAMAQLLADPEVMKFSLDGPCSIERTQKYMTYIFNMYRDHGLGLWAVEHKNDDRFIAYCGHFIHTIDQQREIELGYRFARPYWGKGLATEAGKAVCDYAFNQLKLNRLISIIQAENIASIRVAEKCGLTYEKDSVFHDIPVRIYAKQVN